MIFVKSMVGSFIGAIIGIWMCKWLGWVPSQHNLEAERFFVENWREIVHGILCVSAALAIALGLLVLVYSMYRLAKTIG